VRERWATLRAAISSPADVWLALRMAFWAPLLPVLKRTVPLPRLVRMLSRSPSSPDRQPERERRIARIGRLLYRSRTVRVRYNCLERSLVLYRFLGRAGANPELVVGVRKDEADAVRGHVWVLLDEAPLYETAEELSKFVPILRFRGGELTSAGGLASPLPGAQSGSETHE
jgi:hypothetical protein